MSTYAVTKTVAVQHMRVVDPCNGRACLDRYVTAWVPLANVTTEMGLLTFASGSHNDMALNYWNSGQKQLEKKTASGSFYVYQGKFVEERYTMANYGAMGPGDVSFHAGWTIHGGMPNVGKATREAIAVSWVPEQTKMLPAFDVVGAKIRPACRHTHSVAEISVLIVPSLCICPALQESTQATIS